MMPRCAAMTDRMADWAAMPVIISARLLGGAMADDGDGLGGQAEQDGQAQGQQTEPTPSDESGQGREAQGQNVEPTPGDLDNFFAWVQGLPKADKSKEVGASDEAKETLRQIESNHRADFEAVFNGQYGDEEETKESLKEKIAGKMELIEAIEVFEKAFAKRLGFGKGYELAVVKRDTAFAPINNKDTIVLGDLKCDLETGLAEEREYLEMLKDSKKRPSPETILLRAVAWFLAHHNCNPAHALEIMRLLSYHHDKSWQGGEKLAKENRALLDNYGVPREHRHREKQS